jgi:hypothetical protein
MQIRFIIDGAKALTATLDDTRPAREFSALLPLSIVLEDYAATEKICDLHTRLTTVNSPDSYKPCAGDITYYAPWGNLAIFLKDFQRSSGLIKLGKFDSDIEPLKSIGLIKVHIENI